MIFQACARRAPRRHASARTGRVPTAAFSPAPDPAPRRRWLPSRRPSRQSRGRLDPRSLEQPPLPIVPAVAAGTRGVRPQSAGDSTAPKRVARGRLAPSGSNGRAARPSPPAVIFCALFHRSRSSSPRVRVGLACCSPADRSLPEEVAPDMTSLAAPHRRLRTSAHSKRADGAEPSSPSARSMPPCALRLHRPAAAFVLLGATATTPCWPRRCMPRARRTGWPAFPRTRARFFGNAGFWAACSLLRGGGRRSLYAVAPTRLAVAFSMHNCGRTGWVLA